MSKKPCELYLRKCPRSGPVIPGHMYHAELERVEAANEVTFIAHGFNVDRDSGIESIKGFVELLGMEDQYVTVSVLWPGDHWLRALSYPLEGRDADLSGYELSKFILMNVRPNAKVNLVAHSLGARVALHAVDRLRQRKRKVANVCLMAAAVDADSLAAWPVYRRATEWADRVAVLSSVGDDVLRVAYPIGDLFQAIGFHDDSPGFALGMRGPRPHKEFPVPENVHDRRIDPGRKAQHGHYLVSRDKKPSAVATRNRKSAAGYTKGVLSGDADPVYS